MNQKTTVSFIKPNTLSQTSSDCKHPRISTTSLMTDIFHLLASGMVNGNNWETCFL